MSRDRWDELRVPGTDNLWQSYHENSKTSRFRLPLRDRALAQWQAMLLPSLVYEGYPAVALPSPRGSFAKPLERTFLDRVTAKRLTRVSLSLEIVATLLHYSYGITRTNEEGLFPQGFRAVPSAGALYPLELYVHAASVDGLAPGLYHYEPYANVVRRMADGDRSEAISARLAQPEIARDASLIIFITALFERATTKYGERGYRFALLEAGHVGQNLALVASALDVAAMSVGGYFDYLIDELIEIDGITHSTVYLHAFGGRVTQEMTPATIA